jgi:hypothetical protein
MEVNRIHALVQQRIAHRPIILIGADLDRLAQHVHELRTIGAQRVLIIASGLGTGPVPDLEGYQLVKVDIEVQAGESHAEKAWRRIFATPPRWLVDVIDRFDPAHEAVVIPWRFRTSSRLGTRPVYGPRLAEAVALEDKTRIGAFLTELGIPEPPGAETVPARARSLGAAHRRVDAGYGTVWSGDARAATNSGAKYVRWVRSASDMPRAAAFLGEHCDAVRVAPFLEGVACGMHAFVTRSGTAVFRPVELLILRPDLGASFVDAGFSTMFDPHPHDVATYREIVRTIGNALYDQYGYEGALSVDAILTSQGWAVHDINPRQGGGLVYVRDALPSLPIHLFHHVAAAGDATGVDMAAFEVEVRAAADEHRVVACAFAVERGPMEESVVRVHAAGDEHLEVRYRPLGSGGGRIEVAGVARVGEAIGPKIARALEVANAELGLGLALSAPRDVRATVHALDFVGADAAMPERVLQPVDSAKVVTSAL